MTSFYGPNLEKYTAFQAHQGDIRQLHLTPNGVLSVTPGELRYTTRTGLPIYTMKCVLSSFLLLFFLLSPSLPSFLILFFLLSPSLPSFLPEMSPVW